MYNKNLKDYLILYKNKSIEILNDLINNDIKNLNNKLKERQEIISLINNLEFDKNEFKEISSNLGLLSIENDISNAIKEKIEDTKLEILTFKKSYYSNQLYTKNNTNKNNIFNTKV